MSNKNSESRQNQKFISFKQYSDTFFPKENKQLFETTSPYELGVKVSQMFLKKIIETKQKEYPQKE